MWNLWRGWAGRLRSPRYLIAFLLGLAYFGWIAFGMAQPDARSEPGLGPMGDFLPLLMAILVAVAWVGSQSHRALAFTPPEVQFLFQGPIPRRTLLDYKLARAQARIVFAALIFTLFFHEKVPLSWPLVFVSLWLIIATWHLHQVAAGLVRTSWTQHGRAGLRRHWIPLAIILAAVAVLVATLASAAVALRDVSSGAELVAVASTTLSRPAPAIVLLPFRILVGPLLAPDIGPWAVAALGTLCLWVAHYIWIVRIDAAFEETAARVGAELQAIVAAAREGRGFQAVRARRKGRINAPWFRLKPVGHPAVAVFWKNLTAFTRNVSRSGVAGIILVSVAFRVVLAFVSDTPREAALATATMSAIMAAMAAFMGPLILRNDLRTDFQRLELVRTLPLSGRDLVAAEVAASAASLFLVIAFFLALAAGFLAVPELLVPQAWMLPAGWLLALVLVAPLCALVMCIQNGLAVLYPAWSRFGPTQQQGPDQMGTMMLMMLTTMVLLVIGMLPPVLVGAVIGFRLYLVMGIWAALPAGISAWLTLVGECVGVVVLLGKAYDRMDPSETDLLS